MTLNLLLDNDRISKQQDKLQVAKDAPAVPEAAAKSQESKQDSEQVRSRRGGKFLSKKVRKRNPWLCSLITTYCIIFYSRSGDRRSRG